jgi:hypothetical protein
MAPGENAVGPMLRDALLTLQKRVNAARTRPCLWFSSAYDVEQSIRLFGNLFTC